MVITIHAHKLSSHFPKLITAFDVIQELIYFETQKTIFLSVDISGPSNWYEALRFKMPRTVDSAVEKYDNRGVNRIKLADGKLNSASAGNFGYSSLNRQLIRSTLLSVTGSRLRHQGRRNIPKILVSSATLLSSFVSLTIWTHFVVDRVKRQLIWTQQKHISVLISMMSFPWQRHLILADVTQFWYGC